MNNQFDPDELQTSFNESKAAIEARYVSLGQHGGSAHQRNLYKALVNTAKESREVLFSKLVKQINNSYYGFETLKKQFTASFELLLKTLKDIFDNENLLNKFSSEFEKECKKIRHYVHDELNITVQKRKNNIWIKVVIWFITSFLGALMYSLIDYTISTHFSASDKKISISQPQSITHDFLRCTWCAPTLLPITDLSYPFSFFIPQFRVVVLKPHCNLLFNTFAFFPTFANRCMCLNSES